MQYDEIRIELPAQKAEGLSEWLIDWSFREGLGFQQADETTLDPPPPGLVRFHLYVPPEDSGKVLSALRGVLPEPADLDSRVEVRSRDEDEWRDAWKRYFRTRRIGRLALVPSWEAEAHVPAEGEITLQMDPGRAFGTGGHPSTRLCLLVLDGLAAEDAATQEGAAAGGGAQAGEAGDGPERAPRLGDVLDVGCGCGVLAIAALLYAPGAQGLAIDIDRESLEVTRENAEKNGVLGRLTVAGTDIRVLRERYPLIFANLSGPTLRELATAIRRRLLPGGRLILSGILTVEAQEVAACFVAQGLTVLKEEREEEWSALLLGEQPA